MSTSLNDCKSFISKALVVTNTMSVIAMIFSAEVLAVTLLNSLIEPPSTTIFGVSVDDPLLPVPSLLAFIIWLTIAVVTAASLQRRDMPYFGMSKRSDMITHHIMPKHD